MARHAALVVAGLLLSSITFASKQASLGHSQGTVIVESGTDACATGFLVHNHDGSFENGYTWYLDGQAPPYYGAFGEGYDLGTGTVACGVFWLTTVPWYYYVESDCYIWNGGVGSTPGLVIGLVANVVFTVVPTWPTVGQNEIEMAIAVSGPFTVGYWGHWPGEYPEFYCAADLDGPGGHPWTCIAPGVGYPSGWQDPSIVWEPTRSMGCGVYFEQSTLTLTRSWGSIKALFAPAMN